MLRQLRPTLHVDVDAVKQRGWQENHILVVSESDNRLEVSEREILRKIGNRLYVGTLRTLAHADGLAVLIALHDLNLAARYADRVALLVSGEIKAVGTPMQVLTPELISAAYHLQVQVVSHPFADVPLVLPGNK